MKLFFSKLGENKVAIRQVTSEVLKNCYEKNLYPVDSQLQKDLINLLKKKNAHHREEGLHLIAFLVKKKLVENPK